MELPKSTFISLGFTFQLSTRGNALLKIEKSYPFYDGSRKDLLASYGIIKEPASRNLGHDSGKGFCTRFILNTRSAGISWAAASWGGGTAPAFVLGAGSRGCASTTASVRGHAQVLPRAPGSEPARQPAPAEWG